MDHSQTIGGDTVKLLRGIYPPIPPCFGTPGSARRPLSVIRLKLPNFAQYVFQCTLFTLGLSPLFMAKSWLCFKHRLRLLIFHSTISLARKNFFIQKFMVTSLQVICGLGPTNQKSCLRLCLHHCFFADLVISAFTSGERWRIVKLESIIFFAYFWTISQ